MPSNTVGWFCDPCPVARETSDEFATGAYLGTKLFVESWAILGTVFELDGDSVIGYKTIFSRRFSARQDKPKE